MKKIIVIGAGGHAKVLVDIILKEKKYHLAGFLDNNLETGTKVMGFEVLGKDENLLDVIDEYSIYGGIIAIGDNINRKKISENISNKINGFKFINCIHPAASIGNSVKIGVGNVFMAGSIINSSSCIGNHCIFNTNSSVDHDNLIDDYVNISPNVVIGGGATIKKAVQVGMGAIVLEGLTLNTNCIVGAGSLINKNTKPNSVYYGIPAKFVKKNLKI